MCGSNTQAQKQNVLAVQAPGGMASSQTGDEPPSPSVDAPEHLDLEPSGTNQWTALLGALVSSALHREMPRH